MLSSPGPEQKAVFQRVLSAVRHTPASRVFPGFPVLIPRKLAATTALTERPRTRGLPLPLPRATIHQAISDNTQTLLSPTARPGSPDTSGCPFTNDAIGHCQVQAACHRGEHQPPTGKPSETIPARSLTSRVHDEHRSPQRPGDGATLGVNRRVNG